MIQIGVLGPLVVTVDDRPAEITTPMLRRLLALLVAQAGIPIDAEMLADELWSGQPPRNARKTLAVYVHRLRRILGCDELILFGPSGYTIDSGAVRLDTIELELSAKRVAGATDTQAQLQRLHQRILNDDRDLITPTPHPPAEPQPPAQLPAGVVDFTGRSGPLSEMDAWAAGPLRHAPLLICGGAGLGKTALAIHWGSRYAAATGAGHLTSIFVVIPRTHHYGRSMRLAIFLRSLGTPAGRIGESGRHHQPGKAQHAGRQEQCAAHQPGAVHTGEAVNLLRRLVGVDEVSAEADAATELARLCGLLPLALRIAAANLVDRRSAQIICEDVTRDTGRLRAMC